MANPETQAYKSGDKLIAGSVFTEQVPLPADTYYRGMRLEYQADGAVVADGSNTGDGTITAVIAGAGVKSGAWVFTLTAALTAKLADPDGYIVADDIILTDGGAVTVKIAGITMTITDGGTAWVATDFFTITIEAAGEYVALDKGNVIAIYNGPERTLTSAGVGSVITGGEIYEGGLVDASNAALTMTKAIRAALRKAGFAPRKVG